jgi:hypothetical protein
MRRYLHDTGRNVALAWPVEMIDAGLADGTILCAHRAPESSRPHKPSAAQRVAVVSEANGHVLFDSASYVNLASTTDIYDDWDLWPRGRDLLDDAALNAHTTRVFDVQESLGLPLLAPSPRATVAHGPDAQRILNAASFAREEADRRDPGELWLTIAGTTGFWSSGNALDQLVTGLSRLQPDGWYLVVVRDGADYPPPVESNEVAGVCRTVHSLTQWGTPTIAAYSDLLGLPAIAAGATGIGTGWDFKQRLISTGGLEPQDGEGGSWPMRVTLQRACAVIGNAQADELHSNAPDLARAVTQGPLPPGVRPRADHHLEVLGNLASRVRAAGVGAPAAAELLNIYGRARRFIPDIARHSSVGDVQRQWVNNLERGVEGWMQWEGWPLP